MMPEVGKLIFAGFQDKIFTTNGQAAKLIRDYNVNAFLLRPCNFNSIHQLKQLIKDLQSFAYSLNFERPLLIAINLGMYKFLQSCDIAELTRFPPLLAFVATTNPSLVYLASKMYALELKAIGINMVFGPILDIFSKGLTDVVDTNSLGVRPDEVIRYGSAMAAGFKSSGIITSGSHFPGVGKAFLYDVLETSVMMDDLNQIESFSALPFKALIEHDMLDSIQASVLALPNALGDDVNACLSPAVINDLLREKYKFDKVVISEDIEVQDIFTNYGIGQAASLAIVYARCDMVTVCNSFKYQLEALDFLNKSFDHGNHQAILITALRRIDKLHSSLSWYDKEIEITVEMKQEHQKLAEKVFKNSITLVRNIYDIIPVKKYFDQQKLNERYQIQDVSFTSPKNKICLLYPKVITAFQMLTAEFTNIAANHDCEIGAMVYTPDGLTSEINYELKSSALAVIFVSSLCQNLYQVDLLKELCEKLQKYGKYLIVVSTDSPFCLMKSEMLASTFLCTYDEYYDSLKYLPQIIFENLRARGCIPGTRKRDHVSREEVVSGLSQDGDEFQFEFLINKPVKQEKEPSMLPTLNLESHEISNLLDFDPEMFNPNSNGNSYIEFGNSDGTSSSNIQMFNSVFGRKSSAMSNNSNNSDSHPEKRISHEKKEREKPWVVEEFDPERDKSCLLLVKTSAIADLYFPIYDELLGRAWKYIQRFSDECKVFIVRNPSMGITYGMICVIIDQFDKCGRIEYMIVSRTKRRQSVGEILHQRAIHYITIERSCVTVALGSSFPFFNYMIPKVLNEISTIWQYLETKDKSKINIAESSIQLVGFYKSLGWSHTRHKKGIYQQQRKHILHLSLSNWTMPGETQSIPQAGITDGYSFIESLRNLNISFVVSDDSNPAFNICYQNLKGGKSTDDEEVLYPTMYSKADFIIREEIEEFNMKNKQRNTFLVYAFINNTIAGFCIVYNSDSTFSFFYPLIGQFKRQLDDKVAGITGLHTGLSLHDEAKMPLSNEAKFLVKLGIITTAIQLIKRINVDQAIMHNIMPEEVSIFHNMGFSKFVEYCACFGKKGSFEWVV